MSLESRIQQVRSLLDWVQEDYSPVVFANSFGAEDMVLTDLIGRHYPGIEMFTLDTGRLPEETYTLMQKVRMVTISMLSRTSRSLRRLRNTFSIMVRTVSMTAWTCVRPAAICARWNP